jgi:serine/threonine protein kinase
MGGNNSKTIPADQFANYIHLKTEDFPALGKMSTYEDKSMGLYYLHFESSYAITNPELAESEISQLRKLDGIKNGCALVKSSVGASQLLCFENFSINLTFEYYLDNLSVLSKAKGPGNVDENEIWNLITDLVNYLIHLNSFGMSHGDLQPKNILFTKSKSVKVLCPLIYTTYQNAYKLRLANDDFRSTFSPEMLEDYINRNTSPSFDSVRSDIFSLGICLLCYIHGEAFESFYNFKENIVLFDRVKNYLSLLIKMQFSEELFFFVNLCLKQSAFERATLDYLLKIISKKKSAKTDNANWR